MIPEVEVIAQKACAMFSDFLTDQYNPSSVVILIAPINQPLAVIGASNASEMVTDKIIREFVGSGRREHNSNAEPRFPMLPSAVVAIVETTVNEPAVEVVRAKPVPKACPSLNVNELAAQGCELIVELFGKHEYEVDCFVAICSHTPSTMNRKVTGASTAPQHIVDIMIHNYLGRNDDERLLEDEYE